MNNNTRKKKKRRRKKSLIGRFFKIIFLILIIYFISLVVIFCTMYFGKGSGEGGGIINNIVEKIKPSLPERTICLIAATDNGKGRTDGMMLVSYNSVDNSVSLVSLPRDLKVEVPDDMWEVMVKNYPALKYADQNIQKLTHIARYGNERGMEFLEEYIENLLKIQIDYYAHIDFEAFRYIIDSVGGIYFDVPQNMYYSDPTQDLYINLKKGEQLLDGKKAEHLLRYRHYELGDLQRIKVQQDFMKAFAKKVLNIKSIMSNPGEYYTAFTKYVDTNVQLSDILKYVGEASKIDVSKIDAYTLPCTMKNINGLSYVVSDDLELQKFSYELYRKPTIDPKDIVYEDSYDKTITVLNGSLKGGVANKTKDILEENGYKVDKVGDFKGEKTESTRIIVEKDGYGADLQKFFENSTIVANPIELKEIGQTDIVVILGKNDELVENITDKKSDKNKKDKNISSIDKKIVVLNGGYTSGMATKTKKYLEENGYTVSKVGDSPDKQINDTKIYVNNDDIGKDLLKLFENGEIVLDKSKTDDYDCDIIVVIGIKEDL